MVSNPNGMINGQGRPTVLARDSASDEVSTIVVDLDRTS